MKKENATLVQWIAILNWHHENSKNKTKTAKYFCPLYPNLMIKQLLISNWLKCEENGKMNGLSSRPMEGRMQKEFRRLSILRLQR